ncbi:HSF-type DNA-binding-domain-containing protein [Amylostereum chailletii]|nr:HSF-type DNA-binding-domain-containing protein [Amylostereum chailletii]
MVKNDPKPQATFLTKLYALLERPENHHMIRWDPAGEHIIVERPEQLALHVLPSIYRQSRFASFSRQLNIYGFMRKVNLRNVDPAIDDPDASTWSHPTLNRHSPAHVVANFKRRVPPRLPKPRKRNDMVEHHPQNIPPPRSAIGPGGQLPLSIPSSPKGRARGFSAPGSYPPLAQPGSWSGPSAGYSRSALPPLTVPSDPPMSSSMYNHSPHPLHHMSPSDEAVSTPGYGSMHYSNRGELLPPSSQPYASYQEQNNWSFSPVSSGSSSHSSSISSLLNPNHSSNQYPPTRPTINTSYGSSLSASMPHSASSLSPDSRPTTAYSVSSLSSLPYEEHHYGEYQRPGSGRPLTPTSSRPSSSHKYNSGSSLSVRRTRRHSQAMQPYPPQGPYDTHMDTRPSSASSAHGGHDEDSLLPRSRSMIQLPTVDAYGSFGASAPAEFAYAPPPQNHSHMDNDWSRSVRPSTSASSLSAASQTSSSQAHTPPVSDAYGEADIHRCESQSHLPPR